MVNVLPTVEDALCVHDTAHEIGSASLHDVALRLLRMQDLEHVDSDNTFEGTMDEWALPTMIKVSDEAAAIVRGEVVADDEAVAEAIKGWVRKDVPCRPYFKQGQRVPAYEMWLVRKEGQEKVTPETTVVTGKPVPMVGWLRRSGAYQFPVEAIELSGDEVKFFQVHKSGNDVDIYDHDGNAVSGMAEVVDGFLACDRADEVVWVLMQDGETYKVVDILTCNGVDCTKVNLWDRTKMLADAGVPDSMDCIGHSIKDAKGLASLPKGAYFVRYRNEVLDDISRPFWFLHKAGTVNTGTPLPWLTPASEETVKKAPADKLVAPLFNGPLVQLHKDKRGVSLFFGDGGKNKAALFPQIVSAVENAVNGFIIEGSIECLREGKPLTDDDFHTLKDYSDCDVVFHAYDVAMWQGKDLTGLPMTERLETLDTVLEAVGSEIIRCAFDSAVVSGDALCWDDDAVRPMDASVHEKCKLLHVQS